MCVVRVCSRDERKREMNDCNRLRHCRGRDPHKRGHVVRDITGTVETPVNSSGCNVIFVYVIRENMTLLAIPTVYQTIRLSENNFKKIK